MHTTTIFRRVVEQLNGAQSLFYEVSWEGKTNDVSTSMETKSIESSLRGVA